MPIERKSASRPLLVLERQLAAKRLRGLRAALSHSTERSGNRDWEERQTQPDHSIIWIWCPRSWTYNDLSQGRSPGDLFREVFRLAAARSCASQPKDPIREILKLAFMCELAERYYSMMLNLASCVSWFRGPPLWSFHLSIIEVGCITAYSIYYGRKTNLETEDSLFKLTCDLGAGKRYTCTRSRLQTFC
jgi:hypothetical protein